MPIAGKTYTKRLELTDYPAEEKAYVVVITNPRADTWDNLSGDDTGSRYQLMAKLITEWNFTDEAGAVLDITPENCEKSLSAIDLRIITQTIITPVGLPDAKKNS